MKKLEFFDCEASFGRPGFKREGAPTTKEEMLVKFDRYGIDRAMMRYEYSATGIPRVGNMELLEQIREDERLYPVWYALPHYTGDFPEPEELIRQMKEYNVRMLTLLGGSWTVAEWTAGELFSTMEKHKIPLLLPLGRLSNGFAGLHDILAAHPQLRVIITAVSYTCLRDLYPLLGKFPNLYVCTSTLKTQMGIEEIAEKFGAQRLIFGSGMPGLSGAASVALITYAKLDDARKQMIAAGNLDRLLQEVEW